MWDLLEMTCRSIMAVSLLVSGRAIKAWTCLNIWKHTLFGPWHVACLCASQHQHKLYTHIVEYRLEGCHLWLHRKENTMINLSRGTPWDCCDALFSRWPWLWPRAIIGYTCSATAVALISQHDRRWRLQHYREIWKTLVNSGAVSYFQFSRILTYI